MQRAVKRTTTPNKEMQLTRPVQIAACRRSPGSAVFLLAREGRFIVRAEGTSDVRL
jgi:hypothetical protein